MILHDFIYEWDGKSTDGEKPVSWWPGSYHVKIVRLGTDSEDISYLVPMVVILKNARMYSRLLSEKSPTGLILHGFWLKWMLTPSLKRRFTISITV